MNGTNNFKHSVKNYNSGIMLAFFKKISKTLYKISENLLHNHNTKLVPDSGKRTNIH